MPEDQAPDPTRELPAPPRRTRARRSAADKIRAAQMPVAMRGYDRAAVDAWREEIAGLVERLEEQQPRDAAVKRALDEVGQETTSILQRAHEAADEITSRSRSQADGRLRRAEQEADTTVREAEERVQRLERDLQEIWEQRARLLEEIRGLADEVLGVADDAIDRMPPPAEGDEPGIVVVEGEEPDVAEADGGTDRPDEVRDGDGADRSDEGLDDDVTTAEVAAVDGTGAQGDPASGQGDRSPNAG